jgi:DNA-binding response OmpR family regulator
MRPRIIIIEDDVGTANALLDGLTAAGHDCVVCHSGEDGLTRLGQESFDAVVLDRMLPGRDGVEILLTPREFDLLAWLARHAGRVVSRDELAREVWQETNRATPIDNVIDVHIARLRKPPP